MVNFIERKEFLAAAIVLRYNSLYAKVSCDKKKSFGYTYVDTPALPKALWNRLVNELYSNRINLNPYPFILSDSNPDRSGIGFLTGRSIPRSTKITDHGSDIRINLTFFDCFDLNLIVFWKNHDGNSSSSGWTRLNEKPWCEEKSQIKLVRKIDYMVQFPGSSTSYCNFTTYA